MRLILDSKSCRSVGFVRGFRERVTAISQLPMLRRGKPRLYTTRITANNRDIGADGAMKPDRTMRTAICAILTLATAPLRASDQITPTDDPGSDCVAAVIFTERSAHNRRYDEMYCSVNNAPAAYDTCLRNASANTTVRFFTDRCNAEDEGAYVSFNGQTHNVRRTMRQAHPLVGYAGTYAGGDVTVRIVPRKLIERVYDSSEPAGVRYAVDVFITHDGKTAEIAGIYDNQP
ncbi:MAG: hypothetical protein KAZ45_01525 [Arenimonas sp.]|nr:hypothetical protein [Arenimonas sp.]MBP7917126.1 hypothetical protein [Arenimonas sp.]